jgi:hypothetical protein
MALFTYDDTSRREDLLSIIRDVSPAASNYLVTNLASSTAYNTFHEWPVRNISRYTSDQSVAEGSAPTEPTGDAPTRSNNITAVLQLGVKVSGTQNALRRALPGAAMDDEKKIKLIRLKAAMEWALLNGAKASGASGTARGMAGINNVISTNLTARASGTSMSTTELEDILQNSWDAVADGFVADTILCPMGIKRKIAGFTTGVTRYTDQPDHIYNNVAIYESSSGIVKVIPHKDVINSTGSSHVLAIREEFYRMAFLSGREPKYEPLAKTGDFEVGQYVTELTLESLAERASVKRYGYALTG